jgi:heat shock protein HslJ
VRRARTLVSALALACASSASGARAAEAGAPGWDELANATYTGFEQLGGQVTLHGGRWEGEPFAPGGAERPSLELAGGFRATGDLDGDGVEEAAVFLAERTGGGATVSHLALVARTALGVRHLATATLGDRVQLRSAKLARGRLAARVVRAGAGDALCCPGEVADLAWSWDGAALVPAGATVAGRLALPTLGGRTWVLRGWDLDRPAPELPELTLAVDGERIVGSSGCNRYFATARMSAVRPGEIEIGPLAGTRLACPETVAPIEERYRRLLAKAERASFLAGQLLLLYRDGRGFGALRFEER